MHAHWESATLWGQPKLTKFLYLSDSTVNGVHWVKCGHHGSADINKSVSTGNSESIVFTATRLEHGIWHIQYYKPPNKIKEVVLWDVKRAVGILTHRLNSQIF